MYKALNYWVFGGFGGEKTAFEFIEWAKSQGLDGVELTVGDAIKTDISEAECAKIADFAKKNAISGRTSCMATKMNIERLGPTFSQNLCDSWAPAI